MAGIKEAFGMIEVLRQASPASLAALAPVAFMKRLAKGDYLFRDKEATDSLYFVVEGNLSLHKLNSIGEKKIIFVYGPGKMLNETMSQDFPESINCEALDDAQVVGFPRTPFIAAMAADFHLTGAIMDSMATKIRRMYRQLKNTTGSVSGDKRIAAKLWKLSKDIGIPCEEGIRIDLKLTITYFAEMLGAKRETVSRQVKFLIDEGLVIRQKDTFIIPDREKLMRYFKSV